MFLLVLFLRWNSRGLVPRTQKLKGSEKNKHYDRNGIKTKVQTTFSLDFSSWLLEIDSLKVAKTNRECRHFVPHRHYQRRHKQGRHECQRYQTRHEPAFFCSSLVKSEQAWLRPEEDPFPVTLLQHNQHAGNVFII